MGWRSFGPAISIRSAVAFYQKRYQQGRLMLELFGAIGQFEREIRLERQREGIAKVAAAV